MEIPTIMNAINNVLSIPFRCFGPSGAADNMRHTTRTSPGELAPEFGNIRIYPPRFTNCFARGWVTESVSTSVKDGANETLSAQVALDEPNLPILAKAGPLNGNATPRLPDVGCKLKQGIEEGKRVLALTVNAFSSTGGPLPIDICPLTATGARDRNPNQHLNGGFSKHSQSMTNLPTTLTRLQVIVNRDPNDKAPSGNHGTLA